MIPATQRSDGTWRKPRKVREGGPSRYLPPALRADRSDGKVASTRSLDDIQAYTSGSAGRGTTSSLTAALFLLATFPLKSLHSATQRATTEESTFDKSIKTIKSPGNDKDADRCRDFDESEVEKAKGKHSPLLRVVARAVKNDLGCQNCRFLWRADQGRSCYDSNSSSGDSSGTGGNSKMEKTDWWARLEQVTRSCEESLSEKMQADQVEWIGMELKLRSSDIVHSDGQRTIVEFLKSIVTKEQNAQQTQEVLVGPRKTLVSNDAKRDEGHNAAGGTEVVDGSVDSQNDGTIGDGTGEDELAGQRVVGAMLVFSSSLSKQDRARLHAEAQEAGSVCNGSHGVGEGRFLALTCGFEDRGRNVGVKMSAEKAALAKHLFWLAQGEYHSRYERWSHQEIREVVASGGPTREAHPDLFRLLEKDTTEGGNLCHEIETSGLNETKAEGVVKNSAEGSESEGDDHHRQVLPREPCPW